MGDRDDFGSATADVHEYFGVAEKAPQPEVPIMLTLKDKDVAITLEKEMFEHLYAATYRTANVALPWGGVHSDVIRELFQTAAKEGFADVAGKLQNFHKALRGVPVVLNADGSPWSTKSLTKQQVEDPAKFTRAVHAAALSADVEAYFSKEDE